MSHDICIKAHKGMEEIRHKMMNGESVSMHDAVCYILDRAICKDHRMETFWKGYQSDVYGAEYPENGHSHNGINDAPLTKEEAHEWVSHMKATGGLPWTAWTVEQTTKLLATNGVTLGKLSDWCANALLNMLWSDNPTKTPEQVIAMAKEYVADPDVIPANNRLGVYYRYIAKH